MSGRRDSTCQKHELPKSLRGTEDAEFVWGMITERFPNAAPLLVEMEAVIDRAEDLLEQLRAPCQKEIETSTSLFPDSDDSNFLISAKESLAENDIKEDEDVQRTVNETQVSEDSICEKETDLNYNECSIREQEYPGERSSEYSTAETNANFVESDCSKLEARSSRATKEADSLEQWEKVIDKAMRESANNSEDVNVASNDDRADELIYFQRKCSPREKKKKEDKENAKQSPILDESKETMSNVDDKTIDDIYRRAAKNQEFSESSGKTVNTSLQGCGDEGSSRRTPLIILEEYAKRCKVPVTYQYTTEGPHRHKSNVYVIRGNMAGFAATSIGESEDSAMNSVAKKILIMIGDQQMNDERKTSFVDLSREEMLEIIDFDSETSRETAQRKLYKLCLQKKEKVPKYCIEKIKTYQGLTYVATCTALGYIGDGRGVRECVAKKAAAEELFRQYNLSLNPESKAMKM